MSNLDPDQLLALFEDLVEKNQATTALDLLLTSTSEDQEFLVRKARRQLLDAFLTALSDEQRYELSGELPVDARETLMHGPVDSNAGLMWSSTSSKETTPLQSFGTPASVTTYRPKSCGARMRTDFLALRWEWTVDQAVEFVRSHDLDVRHPFYLYALDEDRRLIGVISMRSIVIAKPDELIASIMTEDVVSVSVFSDQVLAAQRMRSHRLGALPVLDDDGRPAGVITADDVLDIQLEEDTEDMYKMAGVGIKEHAFSPVLESATRRVPWLAFNMAWAFAGAFIISVFEGTLEKVAVLAVFMPMIAGQCGNAGIQTATIVVRSMALGELDGNVVFRLLSKEWTLSLIKGVIFGGILGLVAWLWKGEPFLGLIAGTAMLLNMLVAGTTGVVLPLTLRRLGFDPATIAGVFDTMLTDLMGFLIYLGLATLLISHLT